MTKANQPKNNCTYTTGTIHNPKGHTPPPNNPKALMPPLFVLSSGENKKNTTPMNFQLAAIGELFIHLRPNDEELKK